jgi:hypothetical protein
MVKMEESRPPVSQNDWGRRMRPHRIEESRVSRLEKNSNVLGVEKLADGESRGHRLLAWVIGHPTSLAAAVFSLSI